MMQCQILQKNRINFCELIPMGKNVNKSVVNVKIDNDVKSKLETLAYIKRSSIQDLCKALIEDAIKENANKIEQAEKLRE